MKVATLLSSRHRLKIALLVAAAVMGILGFLIVQNQRTQTPDFSSASLVRHTQDHQKITAIVNNRHLTLELVTTDASRERGLSGRSEIGSDGMLFVFLQPGPLAFWMKEMQFDLDFIWLNDGEVVDITLGVVKPNPGESLDKLPIVRPRIPANQVLEVNKGKVAEWGIRSGDRFVLP